MAGGGIENTGVTAAVAAATTTVAIDGGIVAHIEFIGGERANERNKMYVHCHSIVVRIGHVVGDDTVLAAIGGRCHATVKHLFAESLHRISSVTFL